jgi:hypothetical protein
MQLFTKKIAPAPYGMVVVRKSRYFNFLIK